MVRIPTLKNILRVEEVLRQAKTPLKKEEIKNKLPVKVQHSTLNLILDYLIASRKVAQDSHGLTWVFEESNIERSTRKRIEKTIDESKNERLG
jgi:hypothetical protein